MKRSDISDQQALEACTPWGGHGPNDTRQPLEGFADWQNGSAIQRLQHEPHPGYPFKVVVAKLRHLDQRGLIDYGVSLNYPWRTEEGEALLARLKGEPT